MEGLAESKIATVLSEDFHFHGHLKFQGSLKIKGLFEGRIESEAGHLIIGEKASIQGNIQTGKLSNLGKIVGDVNAKESVILLSGSYLEGQLKTPCLEMQRGAILEGACLMQKKDLELSASNKNNKSSKSNSKITGSSQSTP